MTLGGRDGHFTRSAGSDDIAPDYRAMRAAELEERGRAAWCEYALTRADELEALNEAFLRYHKQVGSSDLAGVQGFHSAVARHVDSVRTATAKRRLSVLGIGA